MTDIAVLASVGVLTLIGLALAFFGFELAKPLLGWAGSVFGAGIGAFVGFAVIPEVIQEATFELMVGLGVGGLLLGALLGYHFIPFVGRIAASIAAFVASSGATIIVLAGDAVIEATLSALPAEPWADPLVTLDALLGTPMTEISALGQPLVLGLVVGIIGAGLAFHFYTDIIALAATIGGAAILGGAIPRWLAILDGNGTVDLAGEFSVFWFAVAVVLGAAFQLARHFEALDPRSGDFVLGE